MCSVLCQVFLRSVHDMWNWSNKTSGYELCSSRLNFQWLLVGMETSLHAHEILCLPSVLGSHDRNWVLALKRVPRGMCLPWPSVAIYGLIWCTRIWIGAFTTDESSTIYILAQTPGFALTPDHGNMRWGINQSVRPSCTRLYWPRVIWWPGFIKALSATQLRISGIVSNDASSELQLVPIEMGKGENGRTLIILCQLIPVQSVESHRQSLLCNIANGQVAFPEFFTRLIRIRSMEAGNGVRWDATNGAVISPGRGKVDQTGSQVWAGTSQWWNGISSTHEQIMPYRKDIVQRLYLIRN